MEPGICYIKPEYLIGEANGGDSNGQSTSRDGDSNKRKHEEEADTQNEAGNKRGGGKKERKRGQNKNRPVFKDERFSHLCHSLIEGPGGEPCTLSNCRYVHDLDAYLEAKGEDLGNEC
ncbi:hypothetical protein ACLKA7_002167 [Drosophila subpalustris]